MTDRKWLDDFINKIKEDKMRNKLLAIFVVVLFLSACSSTPTASVANVVLVSAEIGESRMGSPCLMGYVQNNGMTTASDCQIYVTFYADEGKQEAIDEAEGWGFELEEIAPGARAYFEAPFYKAAPQAVKAWTVIIEWRA